jgi:hypothetical protein
MPLRTPARPPSYHAPVTNWVLRAYDLANGIMMLALCTTACIHAYIYTCIHLHTPAYIHTLTCMPTCANIDIHMRRVLLTLTSTITYHPCTDTGTSSSSAVITPSSMSSTLSLSLSVRLAWRTLLCHGSLHPICLPSSGPETQHRRPSFSS